MMRLLAIVFSATLFAVVLAHEASALRGGGIRAGAVVCEASRLEPTVAGYAPGTLVAIGRPHGEDDVIGGVVVGMGHGAGLGYPANRYRSAYSGAYGYSSGMGTSGASGATATVAAAGPGMCGTYLYWKDGKCNDARAK